MKPYLELHPAGIIVPRIASVEDAQQAVASFRYPPRGVRGYGPGRGVKFGAIAPPNYLADIDRQIMLILQIEHIHAVSRIDDILDVAGVDSIVTGPGDLSGSMGLGGQPGHPEVVAAVEAVYKAAVKKGIPAGHSMGYDPQDIRRWLELGLSWIAVDGDWITLYRHATRVAEEIKRIHVASNPRGPEPVREARSLSLSGLPAETPWRNILRGAIGNNHPLENDPSPPIDPQLASAHTGWRGPGRRLLHQRRMEPLRRAGTR